jgi:hypothetical protein
MLLVVFWSFVRTRLCGAIHSCYAIQARCKLETVPHHALPRPYHNTPPSIALQRIHRVDGRILLSLILKMRIHACLFPHLFDLHVVVCRNATNRDNEPSKVDGRKRVLENEVRSSNSNHLLENATDAKSNDRSALQQSELRRRHKEGQDSWKQKNADAETNAPGFEKL